jgi:hypothetical protein
VADTFEDFTDFDDRADEAMPADEHPDTDAHRAACVSCITAYDAALPDVALVLEAPPCALAARKGGAR